MLTVTFLQISPNFVLSFISPASLVNFSLIKNLQKDAVIMPSFVFPHTSNGI